MDLFAAARACRRCPAVVPASAVLGPSSGPLSAPILFVGEAPGRRGAARTGIPFHGDESGRRFEALLAEAGLLRDQVFVTNALLCLPLDASGRNRRPATRELRACASHLAATIDRVRPQFVVSLGAIALASLAAIEPHALALRSGVACPAPWRGRTLIPLYHPGRQAALHRPWNDQLADWRRLGGFVRESTRPGETRA